MGRTAKNAWLFGMVYTISECRNAPGRIVSYIHGIAAVFTTKAFPLSIPYMQTIRTYLGSISGRNSKMTNFIYFLKIKKDWQFLPGAGIRGILALI
jgi:hypothetical protein